MSHEFRVTVEDLKTGDRKVTEVAAGDYVLTTFDPCYVASAQRYLKAGTVVVTIRDHRPQDAPRTIASEPGGSPSGGTQ